jgi:uncharacterized protein (DUF2147 family)
MPANAGISSPGERHPSLRWGDDVWRLAYVRPMRALLILLALAGAAQAAPRASGPEGVWRNGRDSVRIRVSRCGQGLCGRVVQATPEAEDDAAGGGTHRLVGTELFRELRPDPDGRWYGAVFVPDIGREVEGSLAQTGRDTLVAEGCLFAGIGCKAQTWTRVR